MNRWTWLELMTMVAIVGLVFVDDFRWRVHLPVILGVVTAVTFVVVVQDSWVPAAPMLIFGGLVAVYHLIRAK